MSAGANPGAGRKSDFSEKIAEEIVRRLSEGEGLNAICRRNTMPARQTVIRWQHKHPEFATECARARLNTADLMDEKVMEVVEKVESGELEPDAAKVMLSGIMWRASKLDPSRYADNNKGTSVNVSLHNHLELSEERIKQLQEKKRQAVEAQRQAKRLL